MLPDWNDPESKAQAELDFAAGISARQVATQYDGATRNAVAGHMHRRGIKSPNKRGIRQGIKSLTAQATKQESIQRDRAIAKGQLAHATKKAKTKPSVKLPRPAPEIVNGGVGVAFLDIKRGQCCWPVSGEGADMRYCGQKIFKDKTQMLPDWCLAHQHVGLMRPEKLVPKEYARLADNHEEEVVL